MEKRSEWMDVRYLMALLPSLDLSKYDVITKDNPGTDPATAESICSGLSRGQPKPLIGSPVGT